MKKVVQCLSYEIDNLESHGFTTNAQKRAVCCIAELLEEIKNSPGPFGMMLFFISEKDLFDNMPVTIWSGFTKQEQLKLFEDYVLTRLKMANQLDMQKP